MTEKLREAAQLALDALWTSDNPKAEDAINALQAALAERPARAVEPLTGGEIASIAQEHGLCTFVPEAGYKDDMLWFDGDKTEFARAIIDAFCKKNGITKD